MTGGFSLRILDPQDAITAVISTAQGVFQCTDCQSLTPSSTTFSPGVWCQVDAILDTAAGEYDVYIDGAKIAGRVQLRETEAPSTLRFRIGPNQSGTSSLGLDDVSVLSPE